MLKAKLRRVFSAVALLSVMTLGSAIPSFADCFIERGCEWGFIFAYCYEGPVSLNVFATSSMIALVMPTSIHVPTRVMAIASVAVATDLWRSE